MANQEATPQKVSYSANLTGSKPRSIIPPQFKPTKRFLAILSVIFLAVVALGLFQFPYGSLISGNTDISIDIGYPFSFLSFSLSNPDQFPLNISGFLLDILIYLVLSYAIDVIINLIFNNPATTTSQEEGTSPQIFKNQTQSLADKATQKVIQKTTPQTSQQLQIPTPQDPQPTATQLQNPNSTI